MASVSNNQITVKLHYSRPKGDYAGWNAWMWTLKQGGRQYELVQEGEDRVATIVVDGYTTACLPANLLQAQRDYFGAHTYERIDAPRGEFFHTNWTGKGGDPAASQYVI